MAKQEVVQDWDDKAYLRYLPPHLQERYRDSVSDSQLTYQARQIALMDVRIKNLLEALDHEVITQETIAEDLGFEFERLSKANITALSSYIMAYIPTGFINYRTFKRLTNIVDRLETAEHDGRAKDAERAKKQLFQEIRGGRKEGDVWEDIVKIMDERRKLAEAENRRLNDNQQTMPLDRVVMLCGILIEALKESVLKYVPDREIQQYILREADDIYRRQLGMDANRAENELAVDRHDIG